jgi:GT2 family glycosyltransferase
LIDEAGAPFQKKKGSPLPDVFPQAHADIDAALLRAEWPLVHPAVVMRRRLAARVGGYDERYASNEDHDLFLKLAEVGWLANVPHTLLEYRRHPVQMTQKDAAESRFQLKRIVRRAYRRRGKALPRPLKYLPLRRLIGKAPRLEHSLVSLKRALVG